MLNSNGQIIGTDQDTAAALAKMMGLKMASVGAVFDTMITDVQTKKCDVIISSMDVKQGREAEIDQIGYLVTHNGLLYRYGQTYGIGNPLTDEHSLCGHSIAAEIGSQGQEQVGIWQKDCTSAGLPTITTDDVESNSTLYELLTSGKTQAAVGGPEPAEYFNLQHPNSLEAGPTYSAVLEGIGVRKGNTALENAIVSDLKTMLANGTLLNIMKKYGLTACDVPTSIQVNAPINNTETSGEPSPSC